jgi:hypothetical protein
VYINGVLPERGVTGGYQRVHAKFEDLLLEAHFNVRIVNPRLLRNG